MAPPCKADGLLLAASFLSAVDPNARQLTVCPQGLGLWLLAMAQRDQQTHRLTLSADEVQRVISACASSGDRCLLRILAETGIGRAEVTALDVSDVDLDTRRVSIRSRKGGKPRAVPITKTLALDLRTLLGTRTAGPVFLSNRKAALTTRHVSRIVERAGELARIENTGTSESDRITCYLLRSTFARLWRERGGDLESLAHILGHANPARTLKLYGTPGAEDIQARYELVMDERQES